MDNEEGKHEESEAEMARSQQPGNLSG